MLIVFPDSGRHGAWMKNCRFPLDLVWLDRKLRVVDVVESAPACSAGDCPIYRPVQPATYVLELSAQPGRRRTLIGERLQLPHQYALALPADPQPAEEAPP